MITVFLLIWCFNRWDVYSTMFNKTRLKRWNINTDISSFALRKSVDVNIMSQLVCLLENMFYLTVSRDHSFIKYSFVLSQSTLVLAIVALLYNEEDFALLLMLFCSYVCTELCCYYEC